MGIKTKAPTEYTGLGSLRVMRQDNDLNYEVQIEIMRSGLNRNKWDYRNVGRYASTFRGTPILCAYLPNGQIGDGHNMEEVTGMDGQKHYKFTGPTAERIVGMIYDTNDAVWTEERDGEKWVIARGKLWRFYNPELVDKIAKQGRMDVSAETDILKALKEPDREVYTEWYGLGVTILGDRVAPAIPGANIKAMKAMEQAFKQLKLRAASYHKPQNQDKGVKSIVNAMSNTPLVEKVQKKLAGYRILNMNDTGDHVLMLDSKGAFCTYQSKEDDHDVLIPDRIKYGCLTSQHQFEDGTTLDIDVMAMLSAAVEDSTRRAEAAETERDNLKKDNEGLNAKVKAMNEAEEKRRIKAAKDAVEKAAKETAECMEIDENATKEVMEAVEAACYNSICNESGEWVGDAKAVSDFMSKVGEMAVKSAKEKKAKMAANSTSQYVFEKALAGNSQVQSDMDSMIARNLT